MKIINCDQKSPEWFASKIGIPSASNFDKIVTSTGLPSKQRMKYLHQLAGERITGAVEDSYQNGAILRGIEMESEALKFYEMVTERTVTTVGFCLTDSSPICGASPDGMIGADGILEIKCPLLSTHISYLIEGKLPADYIPQVQGQLFVTGLKWCDFISYYPGLKPLIISVYPDEKFQAALKAELELFCNHLDDLVNQIK